MHAISNSALARMQASAASTFFDSCKVGTPTISTSSTYQTVTAPTWGSISEISCGYSPGAKAETGDGAQAPLNDGRIRLPIATTVTEQSWIQLTKRMGATLATPLLFRVVGDPDVGVTCRACLVKRLDGGANG